jgi:hypothetical protein
MIAEPTLRGFAEDLPDDLAVLNVQAPDSTSSSKPGLNGAIANGDGLNCSIKREDEQTIAAETTNIVSLGGG